MLCSAVLRHGWAAAARIGWVLLSGVVHAQARLDCDVVYAGASHPVQASPVTQPYEVAAVDIAGRFLFKAVVVGEGRRVDRVALYVYESSGPQPMLVQQVKYLPPFVRRPDSLTGEQRLYAGHLQRELAYRCTLDGVEP